MYETIHENQMRNKPILRKALLLIMEFRKLNRHSNMIIDVAYRYQFNSPKKKIIFHFFHLFSFYMSLQDPLQQEDPFNNKPQSSHQFSDLQNSQLITSNSPFKESSDASDSCLDAGGAKDTNTNVIVEA